MRGSDSKRRSDWSLAITNAPTPPREGADKLWIMRAVVHAIAFPDIEQGTQFDPDDTVQLVEISAGPSGSPGEKLFQATVCTPLALSRMLTDGEVLVGRHWLFVDSFKPERIDHFFRKLINASKGRIGAK
nr:Imm8 family immunity protein [uncultured Actinoplanes sp.]